MREQRIVIFGGPDRCGKTTIARALSARWEIPYFKPTNQREFAMKDPNAFFMQTQWAEPKLFDFLSQTKHSVIMDRSFVCDYAYSKVLGRNTSWSTIDSLDEAYGKLNTLLVLTLRRSYEGRADDEWKVINEDKLKQLDEAYRMFAATTNMRSLIIETDDENLEDQLKQITEAFIRQEST